MNRGQPKSGHDGPGQPHRPVESNVVRTTIVGGRPPGSGQPLGSIPRGIEILVKKAAVDPEFKSVLLARRESAADEIGLELAPTEVMMLRAVPNEQLEAIVGRTRVPDEHRRAFLGKVAAVMLAALGVHPLGEAEGGLGMAAAGGIRPQDMRAHEQVPPAPPRDHGQRQGDKLVQGKRPERADPSRGDAAQPDSLRKTVRQRVMELVARRFGIDAKRLNLQTSILKDLRPDPRQMIQFRAELQKEFGINISYRAFKRMSTVGQMIDYLEREIARQEAFNKRRRSRQQGPGGRPRRPATQPKSPRPGAGGTFGVRPDRPPSGGLGGARAQ